MKFSSLLLFGFVAACSHDHAPGDAHGHDHGERAEDERPALSFTDWTETSELFIELPALVVGKPSACAAHVTKLDDFSAPDAGRVTAILRGPSGDERFASGAPTVPGIFRPVIRPTSAGRRQLIVQIHTDGIAAEHDLGAVVVYPTTAAARAAIPEAPEAAGRVVFLKEQQWPIAFGTSMATERAMRASLRATGTVRARADGEVVITAPVAGRLLTGGAAFPRVGDRVSMDDVLAVLTPRLDAADVASLELAVTSASLEVRFAERERQRLEALRVEGAVPERRAQDAAHVAEEASAALSTAQRRLGQFRGAQRSTGRGAGAVALRAPLVGTVTDVRVAPGTFVEAGAPLFRVTDLTRLWLEVRVPASDAARLDTPRGASAVIEGFDAPIELAADALVGRGHIIDQVSRTLPLLFAVENASSRFPIGAFARVSLAVEEDRSALAVPESALVDDGGVFVVFVQVEGEAFERRVVRLGVQDRGYVEVLRGVRAGEHVVSRGGWSVKLAAASGVIPAHGHAH